MSEPADRPWLRRPPADEGLAASQRDVDEMIGGFREGYWPPLVNLARLTEEVGELAREMNHLFGKKTKRPEEGATELALELADILFVVIAIANERGIDLQDAFERVLEKYRARDGDRWERKEPGESSGGNRGRNGDEVAGPER